MKKIKWETQRKNFWEYYISYGGVKVAGIVLFMGEYNWEIAVYPNLPSKNIYQKNIEVSFSLGYAQKAALDFFIDIMEPEYFKLKAIIEAVK